MKKNKNIDQTSSHTDRSIDNYVRDQIRRLIESSKTDCYASISALLGRSHSYIQQYITRGSPKLLREEDRRKIAHYFGISPRDLLVSDHDHVLTPHPSHSQMTIKPPSLPPDVSEERFARNTAPMPFSKTWLLQNFQLSLDDVICVIIDGDSMAPTICPGDQLLVDRSSALFRDAGLYLMHAPNGGYTACRITLHPTHGRPILSHDNTVYPIINDCDWNTLNIIGQIIWFGRTLITK